MAHGIGEDRRAGVCATSLPSVVMTRRRSMVGFIANFGALLVGANVDAMSPVVLEDTLPKRELVLDETNLLAPSTRKYLDKVLRRLQGETGLKVRVICPPLGLQENKTAFKEFLRPVYKDWAMDASSLGIVAEQRVQKRWGRTLPLLSIQPGYRLQERFQYRLTQDFVIGVADAFGNPQYYQAKGTDVAIQEATENVAAGLFNLVDDASARYFAPLPPAEVTAILRRHGL